METNESFLLFLKHQVKGVFDNKWNCIHPDDNESNNNVCFKCIQDFIFHSKYKEYINNLYNWFYNVFQHNYKYNIIKCFENTHNYFTSKEQVSYFCSSWLDGIYSINENYIPGIYTIIKSLCLKGHLETLKWLYLQLRSDFEIDNESDQRLLFENLCEQTVVQNPNGHKILSWLLSQNQFRYIRANKNGFLYACKNGHLKIVELLLSYDIMMLLDKNDRLCSRYSTDLTDNRLIDIHANNEEAFRWSCSYGRLEIVKLLLSLSDDRRIDVHAKNENAFWYACRNGHLKVVELLLNLDGDRRINVHAKDDYAFKWACDNGHLEVVKLLLNLDGDRRINVHVDNEYAFRYACGRGHLKVVEFLLSLSDDRRINVHAKNEDAFKRTCDNGEFEVVELLLSLEGDRRIDVHIDYDCAFKRACGMTRYTVPTCDDNHFKVIELLLKLKDDRKICVYLCKDVLDWAIKTDKPRIVRFFRKLLSTVNSGL